MISDRLETTQLLKILFVEDDPESTELFVGCLDSGYTILTTDIFSIPERGTAVPLTISLNPEPIIGSHAATS